MRVFDFMESVKRIYVVAEWLPFSLRQQVEDPVELGYSRDDAIFTIRQVCLGLAHCHDRGIVHMNIDLSSIRSATNGTRVAIKLCEFERAERLPEERRSVIVDPLIATDFFTAPEVGSGDFGVAADMWSVGIVFFSLYVFEI